MGLLIFNVQIGFALPHAGLGDEVRFVVNMISALDIHKA